MSHIWMSHITHMNKSCHTYEWVMSHMWMSHVTHMNQSCHTESCHTYGCVWVMSHMWLRLSASSENAQANLCPTYEWDMSHIWRVGSHIWMSHVTIMNGSCHTYLARNLINVHKCPHKKSGWKEMSRINESRHIIMGYVTHIVRGIRSIWSHVTINESRLRWRHVTYRWVMSHMNELRHTHRARNSFHLKSCHYKWVTSQMKSCHTEMSHVTHMVRGIRSIWSHVTINDSRLRWSHVTYRWVMSHMNELRHTHRARNSFNLKSCHFIWFTSQMKSCHI